MLARNPTTDRVPDMFVALRAPRQEGRRFYWPWEEPPELVIDVRIKGFRQHLGSKRATRDGRGFCAPTTNPNTEPTRRN